MQVDQLMIDSKKLSMANFNYQYPIYYKKPFHRTCALCDIFNLDILTTLTTLSAWHSLDQFIHKSSTEGIESLGTVQGHYANPGAGGQKIWRPGGQGIRKSEDWGIRRHKIEGQWWIQIDYQEIRWESIPGVQEIRQSWWIQTAYDDAMIWDEDVTWDYVTCCQCQPGQSWCTHTWCLRGGGPGDVIVIIITIFTTRALWP